MQLLIPPWYRLPLSQVILVGFTCFCTTGMFSAVSNLGAGGTEDIALSDMANGVHYGCFAIMGLFAGGVTNLLGVRPTLFLGAISYALYMGSLWCFQTQGTRWFVVFAGAILGISAALLWSAQGAIMMSYPLEKDKGKAFAVFWAIFQSGSFLGAIIALAINIQHGGLSAVSTGTYLAFLIIMLIGTTSSLLVLPPASIVRGDGSLVKVQNLSSPREEIRSFFALFKDWRMLALTPMFFASNYFYAYQGAINTFYFDGPTRALNAALEGAGAIVGALIIGIFVLDAPRFKRRMRGWLGLAFVSVCAVTVWSCALVWQTSFTRASNLGKMSYHDSAFAPKGTLYFFFYFSDAAYQALAYWIMGAITNDPFKLARYAGFYKAIQSAGSAGSYGMDAVATPFLNEHLASWTMVLVSLPLAGLVIYHVHDTSYQDEQTVFANDSKVNNMQADVDPEAAGEPEKQEFTANTCA
ncbi:MFS general substrate transporter [Peniophora sp. CONT]|nr:MFS general substrate transporter [Peniophora sp. CONT]